MTLLPSAHKISQQSITMPAGSIDTHAHIFERHLPMASDRRYTPDYDAPLSRYLQMLDEHGIAKGVLVQPSFLGIDNSYLLRALRSAGDRLRGVVVVDASAPVALLKAMDADGVVGIRLNLVGRDLASFDTEPWSKLLANVGSLNWFIEVQRPASDLELALPAFLKIGVPVLVDHFGLLGEDSSRSSSALRLLESAAKSRRVWIKISAPYRLRGKGGGEERAQRIYPDLRDAVGLDRLVWGSDWPHTQYEDTQSYFHACSSLLRIVRNEKERRQILQTNALSLFRFTKHRELIEGSGGS